MIPAPSTLKPVHVKNWIDASPYRHQIARTGMPADITEAFYCGHAVTSRALRQELGDQLADVHQLMVHQGPRQPDTYAGIFAAPACARELLRYGLDRQGLEVELVTAVTAMTARMNPLLKAMFRPLGTEGVSVRDLRLAGLGDPPDALVLLPCRIPAAYQLEREPHGLRIQYESGTRVVGLAENLVEVELSRMYLELFGAQISVPNLIPIVAEHPELILDDAYSWRLLEWDTQRRPEESELIRFRRLQELLLDGMFDESLFQAGQLDLGTGMVDLMHGCFMSPADGTVYYVDDDAIVEAEEGPDPVFVPEAIRNSRPRGSATLRERWEWVLDARDACGEGPAPFDTTYSIKEMDFRHAE